MPKREPTAPRQLTPRLQRWYEREREIYLAWTGRDGSDDGFREHIRKVVDSNPEPFIELLIENEWMNESPIPARKN
jgi:hypothetical protein